MIKPKQNPLQEAEKLSQAVASGQVQKLKLLPPQLCVEARLSHPSWSGLEARATVGANFQFPARCRAVVRDARRRDFPGLSRRPRSAPGGPAGGPLYLNAGESDFWRPVGPLGRRRYGGGFGVVRPTR
jgi:hypothetical protein